MDIDTIVVHSGPFHADDVIGVAILKTLFPCADIIRTRDGLTLSVHTRQKNSAVIDVGGVCDITRNNFDHHQREGAGLRESGVPYAAAGLTWQAWGEIYISRLFPRANWATLREIAQRVDREFLEFVDAVDNGALAPNPTKLKTGEGVKGCSISTLIHMQNPANGSASEFDAVFLETVSLVEALLMRLVQSIGAKYLGETRVREAIQNHLAKNDRDPVLVLQQHAESWQSLLCQLDPGGQLLYVVFQAPDGTWMVQQAPTSEASFEGRKPLPEAWAGLRDEALQSVSSVADAVFCHRGRFICGARSLEGALALARSAVLA